MNSLLCSKDFSSGIWDKREVSGTATVSNGVLSCSGASAYYYASYLLGPGDILEVKVVSSCIGASGASISISEESLPTVVSTIPIPLSPDKNQYTVRYVVPSNKTSVLAIVRLGNEGGGSSLTESMFFDPEISIINGPHYQSYRVIASGMVRSTNAVSPELSTTFTNFGVHSVSVEDSTTFRVTLDHKYGNYAGTLGNRRPLMFCSITGDGTPPKVCTIGNFTADSDGRAYCLIRAYNITDGSPVVISPNTESGQSVFISFMIVAP